MEPTSDEDSSSEVECLPDEGRGSASQITKQPAPKDILNLSANRCQLIGDANLSSNAVGGSVGGSNIQVSGSVRGNPIIAGADVVINQNFYNHPKETSLKVTRQTLDSPSLASRTAEENPNYDCSDGDATGTSRGDIPKSTKLAGIPPPPLPAYHVMRHDLESQINEWLKVALTKDTSLLVLGGLGSAGKTCLSQRTYHLARELGFTAVIWLYAKDLNPAGVLKKLKLGLELTIDCEEKDLSVAIKNNIKERNIKILVILDDVSSDDLLQYDFGVDHFVVTTRDQSIGKHTRYISDKKVLPIEGLDETENETLITKILDKDILTELCDKGKNLYETMTRLCTEVAYMPLMTNIIANLIKENYDIWRHDGNQFMTTLTGELNQLKVDILKAEGAPKDEYLHIGTDYPFPSIYSAIKLSIDYLNSKLKSQFQCVAAFGKGQRILPITLCRWWSDKNIHTTIRTLKRFCDRSLLINESTDQENVFRLHDVVFDVVQIITEPARQSLSEKVIDSYLQSTSNVPIGDEFFYSSFIQFCLNSGRDGVAADCLCQLGYLMERVNCYCSIEVLRDFQLVRARLKNDRRLEMYENVMKQSYSDALRESDPQLVLRFALLQHHEDAVFHDARAIVKDMDTDDFYHFRDNPILTNMCHPQRLPIPMRPIESCKVHDYDGTRHLLLFRSPQVMLYDRGMLKMVAVGDAGDVKLAQFLTETSFIVVTEFCINILDIVEASGENERFPFLFQRRPDIDVVETKCEVATWQNGYLWIASSKGMSCYHLCGQGFVKEFDVPINLQMVTRIATNKNGRVAAVSPFPYHPSVFSLDNPSSPWREIHMKGVVMEINDNDVGIISLQDKKFCFYKISEDNSTQLIYPSNPNTVNCEFSFDYGNAIFFNSDRECVILPDLTTLTLSGCSLYMCEAFSVRKNYIFMFDREENQVLMCNLEESSGYLPHRICKERIDTRMHWCNAYRDFVTVQYRDNGHFDIRTLLTELPLLTDVEIYSSWPQMISVSPNKGRLAGILSANEIIEWDIQIRGDKVESSLKQKVKCEHPILAFCHSNEKDRLFVIIKEENEHVVYQVEGNELIRQRILPFSSVDLTDRMFVCDKSNTLICSWGTPNQKLIACHLEGNSDAIFGVEGPHNLSLSPPHCLVRSKKGVELWNLLNGHVDMKMEAKHVTDCLINSNGSIVVFTVFRRLCIVKKKTSWEPVFVSSGDIRRIVWSPDEHSVVTICRDGVRVVDVDTYVSRLILLPSWVNVSSFTDVFLSPCGSWLLVYTFDHGFVILKNIKTTIE